MLTKFISLQITPGIDPQLIVDDICRGINRSESCVIELDRARAIHAAISEARAGAMVLIAGKGHEQEQIVSGKRLPFSDYDVAHSSLQQRAVA